MEDFTKLAQFSHLSILSFRKPHDPFSYPRSHHIAKAIFSLSFFDCVFSATTPRNPPCTKLQSRSRQDRRTGSFPRRTGLSIAAYATSSSMRFPSSRVRMIPNVSILMDVSTKCVPSSGYAELSSHRTHPHTFCRSAFSSPNTITEIRTILIQLTTKSVYFTFIQTKNWDTFKQKGRFLCPENLSTYHTFFSEYSLPVYLLIPSILLPSFVAL